MNYRTKEQLLQSTFREFPRTEAAHSVQIGSQFLSLAWTPAPQIVWYPLVQVNYEQSLLRDVSSPSEKEKKGALKNSKIQRATVDNNDAGARRIKQMFLTVCYGKKWRF